MRRIIFGLPVLASLVLLSLPAGANEFTDVIDAWDFDLGDPYDLSLFVGYERLQRTSLIRREAFKQNDLNPHPWDYFAYRDMFDYKQLSHILHLELEAGIYKDLSFKVRLPLILKDTRELTAHKDMLWTDSDGDGDTDTLFATPFKSPERSGIDFLAVGLWWGILDQGRDDTKPNWTIFAEGRFGVGKTLQAACREDQRLTEMDGGSIACQSYEGGKFDRSPGISRGLNEFAFGLRLSRRYGFWDPYFGLEALVGFPKEGTPYKQEFGAINDMPPMVGTIDFGLELVPWDVPELERKLVIGLGGGGKYHSEGREYTPLFDVLGTAPYFHDQPYVDFNGSGTEDPNEAEAVSDWEGMTDVENYATFFGKLWILIQPAKYIKFRLGIGLAHETEHFITKTDQCEAGMMVAGECEEPNSQHRPELDDPGNRFRVEDTLLWSFFVDATAMF